MKFKYFICAGVVMSLLLSSAVFDVQRSLAQRRTVVRTLNQRSASDNTPGVATTDDQTLRNEEKARSAARSTGRANDSLRSIASWWDRLSGADRLTAEQDDPDLPTFMQGGV